MLRSNCVFQNQVHLVLMWRALLEFPARRLYPWCTWRCAQVTQVTMLQFLAKRELILVSYSWFSLNFKMLFVNFVDLVHRFLSAARTQPPQKKLDNGQSFQRPKKKTKNPGMVTKFDPYRPLLTLNRGNRILIVFHLFCCSKHKLSTILTANVAILVRFIMLTF